MTEAQGVFKKARLTPEQAQIVTDAYQDVIGKMMTEHTSRIREWETNAKKDTYFVDGGGFDQNLGAVRQAVNEYGDAELKEVLNFTGAGSHPAVLRFIKKMAKAIGGEAKAPTSETSNRGQQQTHAETLYPSMVKR